ncbi:MAG: hypothetical protein DRJ32_04810 [Thermoprotei archaeon]|nr:MAG: hypothetical protein DRJ32_04810 [Thermoprotei archaeon]
MIRNIDEILRIVVNKYRKNPLNWRFLASRDRYGYLDFLISHSSRGWKIKAWPLNPYRLVGLGAELSVTGDLRSFLDSIPFTFGIRELPSEILKKTLKENPVKLLDILAKTRPVAEPELRDNYVLIKGPLLGLAKPLEGLSSSQRELDRKLRIELEKLIHKKYSDRVRMYQ